MYSSCSVYRLGDEALPELFSFGEHTAVEASVGRVTRNCEEWRLDFNGGWTERGELGKETAWRKSRRAWILKAGGRKGIV